MIEVAENLGSFVNTMNFGFREGGNRFSPFLWSPVVMVDLNLGNQADVRDMTPLSPLSPSPTTAQPASLPPQGSKGSVGVL